jgi:hypothetical protein
MVTAWTATADYLAVQQEMLEELGKSIKQTPGDASQKLEEKNR